MDVQHLNVKLFVRDPERVNLEDFLSIFNQWIQRQVCEELLVDVADYRHVPAGPGVVLIGHEANYSMDCAGSRIGLLYNRKSALDGSTQDRIDRTMRSALLACSRLEEDPLLAGRIKFTGERILLLINDRLLCPNTDETFHELKPDLLAFSKKLFGGAGFALNRNPDPRERFNVELKAEEAFAVPDLLANLSEPAEHLSADSEGVKESKSRNREGAKTRNL